MNREIDWGSVGLALKVVGILLLLGGAIVRFGSDEALLAIVVASVMLGILVGGPEATWPRPRKQP